MSQPLTTVNTAALLSQIPGPARFPPPTDDGLPTQPPAPTTPSFVSPFFHERKPLQFYARLLAQIHDYARSADQSNKNVRGIVWREVSQFAGRPAPLDAAAEASAASGSDAAPTSDYGYLEPLICRLVRGTTVNLVALEIVYEGFQSAQRRYADVFCNMFPPLADAAPASPPDQNAQGGSRQRSSDSIWGHTIQSSLLQLNLLQSWMTTLDKLSPVHKKIIWDTCRLVPAFRNSDQTSFRKTINCWIQDPLPNGPSISAMFSAIGFLSFHNVLKHEFYYPNVRVAVFSKEPQTTVARMPPAKRPKREDEAAITGVVPPPTSAPVVIQATGAQFLASSPVGSRQAQLQAQLQAAQHQQHQQQAAQHNMASPPAQPPAPVVPAGQTVEKVESLVDEIPPPVLPRAPEWGAVSAPASVAAVPAVVAVAPAPAAPLVAVAAPAVVAAPAMSETEVEAAGVVPAAPPMHQSAAPMEVVAEAAAAAVAEAQPTHPDDKGAQRSIDMVI